MGFSFGPRFDSAQLHEQAEPKHPSWVFFLRVSLNACIQKKAEKEKQGMRQHSVLVLIAAREQGDGERSEHPAQLHEQAAE
jgi:hypothetical protein